MLKGGPKTEFHKETFWRCNYCSHQFKDANDPVDPPAAPASKSAPAASETPATKPEPVLDVAPEK